MRFRLTPPRRPVLCERDVVKACVDFLRYRHYWVQRNPVGKFKTMRDTWVEFGPIGIPDYTAMHETYPAFFLEFKRPGGKLRPSQVDKFQEIRENYRLTAVKVDDLDGLVEWLDGYEARHRKAP